MGGLYDQYKLTNSTVVPMFTGTTAPEALQVGKQMQGLYDIASSGAGDITDALGGIQSMDQDYGLQTELRNKVVGDIEQMSKSRDWENNVEKVRSLGRYFANRSAELAMPLKQYQEYAKSLEEDNKNLTPEQKQVLLMRSRANYRGLSKDPTGRYVGSFNGIDAADNMDLTKWADGIMQGMAEFKGGSIVEYADGKGYLVKKGGSTSWVSEQRVQQALNNALQMDPKVKAFMEMEGDNAGFLASRVPIDAVPDNPIKQQALKIAKDQGLSPEQIYGQLTRNNKMGNLMQNTSEYLRTKYAYKKSESVQGLSADGTWAHNDSKAADIGLFGDLVSDAGIDLTQRFGSADDIKAQLKTNGEILDKASTEVMAQKQVIAKALGTTADKLNDKQIADYYTKNDKAGFGKYKSNLQLIESTKQSQAELNQLQDEAMDLSVKKKHPGQTYSTLKDNATKDFRTAVQAEKLSFKLGNTTVNSSNINNYEVVDGDKAYGNPGNYIMLRDKTTGKQYKVQTKGSSGSSNNSFLGGDGPDGYVESKTLQTIGGRFDGLNWKDTWKTAATNIRSNSMWMPLLNKTTPDGQTTKSGAYAMRINGLLRAGSGGLSVKDANLTTLDSDDTRNVRSRISAGQFDVLGVGKVGSDGKLYVKLSVVKDAAADDPADKYQTVVVGVDSNMANKLSEYAVQAGQRDQDQRTFQFGLAMKPGSGYEQVLNMGTTGNLQVNDVSVSGAKGAPLYEVVPNITGQASDAISYEVYKLNSKGERIASEATFNDAFDLGAFLDMNRSGGRTVEKKNK